MNSTISECDHNCQTESADLEIGPDGSRQTLWNLPVAVNGSGIGLPRASRSGFWTAVQPKRPVLPVQTRTPGGLPGPIANTSAIMSDVIVATRCGNTRPRRMAIKQAAVLRYWREHQVNTEAPKMILKYHYELYLLHLRKKTKIASLIHTRDWAVSAWT